MYTNQYTRKQVKTYDLRLHEPGSWTYEQGLRNCITEQTSTNEMSKHGGPPMEKLCRALGSNKKELALWEKPSSLRGINQVGINASISNANL